MSCCVAIVVSESLPVNEVSASYSCPLCACTSAVGLHVCEWSLFVLLAGLCFITFRSSVRVHLHVPVSILDVCYTGGPCSVLHVAALQCYIL